MRAALLIVGLSAGCGRIAFDLRDDAAQSVDGRDDAPLPAGLIAWFRLDDPAGIQFTDSVAGHDGACTPPACPTPAAAHVGGGFSFDAVDDCITVLDDGRFQTPNYTLAMWSRQLSDGGQSQLSKLVGAPALRANSWQLEVFVPQVLSLTTQHSGIGSQLHSPDGTLTLGAFQHIAATYDGQVARIYVGGTEVITDPNTLPISYDSGAVQIGCDVSDAGLVGIFDGVLDDVRIYDRALDATEIAALAAM